MKLFITGTDTEVGKTYIAAGLLKAFNQRRLSTIGVKPVSSGSPPEGQHSDAELLQQAASIKLPFAQINPFHFKPAIAPHIAAKAINQTLQLSVLLQKTQWALNYPADVCIVEGFGGWKAPLNDRETMADFAKALQLKTILVVGMRLGCLNHALLTYEALQRDHVPLVGWVANGTGPSMPYLDENIATLQAWLNVPFLGAVKQNDAPEDQLDTSQIIKMG